MTKKWHVCDENCKGHFSRKKIKKYIEDTDAKVNE
jgi:hypothetical protein